MNFEPQSQSDASLREAEPLLPDLTVAEAFALQATRTPEAVAIVHDSDVITYAELSEHVNSCAAGLAAIGLKHGDAAAVLMGRSPDLIVTLLGIARVGAAYVPLDVRAPQSRTDKILRNTHASVIVADAAHVELAASTGLTAVMAEHLREHSGSAPANACDPEATFYIMHTSGSTGEPKGVVTTHRNVMALALDRVWASGAHSKVLFHSPYAFDASTYELWVPLLSGGCVVVAPEDVNARLLRRLAADGRVTALWLTAGVFAALAEGDPGCFAGIREVWTGGDVVSPRAVRRVAESCPSITIYNGYGPTETTTFATRYRILPGPVNDLTDIPIGTPMDHTKLYVLDERGRPVEPGETGELHVAGAGIASGYIGRPDLTEERFLADPFEADGSKMYATGDLVRWDEHGRLRYVARIDDQVKIHGFRIEPGEIETVLVGHPEIAQGAVRIDKGQDGSGRIVAFVVAADPGVPPGAGTVRAFLERQLPDYMLPGKIIFLSEMPLTANGKVDRSRLIVPSTQPERADASSNLVTPTQRRLAELWTRLLQIEVTSSDASFQDLGGHSLRAITMVSEIEKLFGVQVRVQDIFRSSQLADLADIVDGAKRSLRLQSPEAGVSDVAASDFQRRMWVAERLRPEPGLYNVQFAWRVHGVLDAERLNDALAKVVNRHEALRTVFREAQGELRQVITQAVRPDLSQVSCSDEHQWLAQEAARPFDLQEGPLLRAALLTSSGGTQTLSLSVHHIIFDIASVATLLKELAILYEDVDDELDPPVQFRELARASSSTAPALERWVQRLAGAPSRLIAPMEGVSETHGIIPLRLSTGTVGKLQSRAQALGLSWFMAFAGIVAGALHRWTEKPDITFGIPVDMRDDTQHQRVIGPCLNTCIIRSKCHPETTWGTLLTDVGEEVACALADRSVPYGQIIEAVGAPRSADYTPFLDVVLAPQMLDDRTLSIAGRRLEPLDAFDVQENIGKFHVTIGMEVSGESLSGKLLYRGDRLSRETANNLAAHVDAAFVEILTGNGSQRVLSSTEFQPAELSAPRSREAQASGGTQTSAGLLLDIETRLHEIWCRVLDTDEIGVTDNFFDLGGDSLKLIAVHAELCRTFQSDLQVQTLFENPTIRTLARYLAPRSSDDQPQSGIEEAADVTERAAARRHMVRRHAERQ